MGIQWDSVGLSPSALSGPICDDSVTAVEFLTALISTNKERVTPTVKAITMPENSTTWTIRRVLYRGGEAHVKALSMF